MKARAHPVIDFNSDGEIDPDVQRALAGYTSHDLHHHAEKRDDHGGASDEDADTDNDECDSDDDVSSVTGSVYDGRIEKVEDAQLAGQGTSPEPGPVTCS